MNWFELLPLGYGVMRSDEGWCVTNCYGDNQTGFFERPEQAVSAFALNYEGKPESSWRNYYVKDGKVTQVKLPSIAEVSDAFFNAMQKTQTRLRPYVG